MSSAAVVSGVANWPAVLFFVAALIVLRLSLRLAGGAAGSRVLFLPRRLVTRLLVPAISRGL